MTWPAGLQSMAFGKFFNQNLDNVTCPAGLQRLLFLGTAKVCKAQMRCQGHWVTWRLESCRGKVELPQPRSGFKGKGGSKRRQQKGASFFSYLLHPGRLTCNLRIHPWKRKIIFQTIIFRFYVNLPGRKHHSNTVVSLLVKENGSKN